MRDTVSWLWGHVRKLWQGVVGNSDWLPLVSLSALIALLVYGVATGMIPDVVPDVILGFDGDLVAIGVVAGFLGSSVRVLNRAVNREYQSLSVIMKLFVGWMRPVAGAMLGLFILFVFASSFVGMPIGDPEDEVFEKIKKGHAFIFAAAFVAGLIDEFVIGIANRFVRLAIPKEQRQRSREALPEEPDFI